MSFFWEEISHPSFLLAPNLHWSCAEHEKILLVEWSRQKTLCKDIEVQSKSPKLECLYEKKIQIPMNSCSQFEIETTLIRYRFSAFDALYNQGKTPTLPNPSLELENKWHLPTLEFHEKENPDLEFPQLNEWLLASGESNFIQLNLQNSNTNNEALWTSFLRWYSLQDSPLKLKYRSPIIPMENINKNSSNFNAIPKLIYKQNFPLGKELCGYLENWFLSRWLIQGKKIENSPKLEIECRLDFISPSNLKNLEITRLPIPLISSKDRLFPFATKDNILDPRIWNTLGGYKP
ncbi:MAG: hypothetical protein KA116_07785 [Proteobacteria bacterium]|nr:hypothetical protein [Pseudomonadota bacterium]